MPNIPKFSPAPVTGVPEPFDDPDWLYELQYDGFRALAYVRGSGVELHRRTDHVSREFASLCAAIETAFAGSEVVLDGEIACLDAHGHSQFETLMYGRGEPCFVAFDVLWHAGTDLRALPLWKRKQVLRAIVPRRSGALLYADSVARRGTALYQIACEQDLEGIVAKWRHGAYSTEPAGSWLKIKNPTYSQAVGRHERFERRRAG